MGDFKRSPSKVWWGNESDHDWRTTSSSSPGSQDSGFSDSEIHQTRIVPKNIFGKNTPENDLNLSINYKEKKTPVKNSPLSREKLQCHSEPTRKNRYTKYSPKVNRSLFARKVYSNELVTADLYSVNDNDSTDRTHSSANDDETSDVSTSSSEQHGKIKSLPNLSDKKTTFSIRNLNKTAPPILETCNDEYEGVTAFNSLNYSSEYDSECDKELEDLFNDLDSPTHHSTPKADAGTMGKVNRRSLHTNLLLKFEKERVPPIYIQKETEDKAVLAWLNEYQSKYEPECMISLQSKSIAAEINEKIAHLSNALIGDLRNILIHSNRIENNWHEIQNIETSTVDMQNFITDIKNFFKKFNKKIIFNGINETDKETLRKKLSDLYMVWTSVRQNLCTESVKILISKLEYPSSEVELKATAAGVATITLLSQSLIESFVSLDAIPILLIQCEKSEGSSTRCLLLRALSTLCCTTSAVRYFEKYSGIQLVTDVLDEESRPEPERSEAVTLLAQVTAPWVEDNYNLKGLTEHSKRLVKSLTKFVETTRCGQNLLLCTAALSNLTAMDTQNTSKHLITYKTIQKLLTIIDQKPGTSIYIFEQVASLLANVSTVDYTKDVLIESNAPIALLHFLQVKNVDENIEKRLQQKVMIALSRLCGDQRAAEQIVKNGGVRKLVKLCKEKEERFNSDAVLVASLASLRKIVETCGKKVISSEDSQELIEPKLLDSFLAYSNQNESYV